MGRAVCLLALLLQVAAAAFRRPFVPRIPTLVGSTPRMSTANCTEQHFEQRLDHFAQSTDATYSQRYYTYEGYFRKGGPIFFYTGNEADVGLYVNATGLIWENAEEFGAYVIFAEHRYYGESIPTRGSTTAGKGYPHLSSEQALADYATLILHLKQKLHAEDSPVIAFGGSYGGKLSAWMRMKYPASVQGSISGSAPLLAFLGEEPAWNSNSYYQVITRTAAQYSANCSSNIQAAIGVLDQEQFLQDSSNRAMLSGAFHLCKAPTTDYEVTMLKYFIRDAFDELAMGNYPWPSDYIAGTAVKPMPAYPVKEACAHLSKDLTATSSTELLELFSAVGDAVNVLYNVTGASECNALPVYPTPVTPGEPMDGIWDYQWCTEMMPDSFWFSTTGESDMFWPNLYNQSLVDEHCQANWAVSPQREWITAEYGGRQLTQGHTNIFFSSGSFDGWASAGVASNYSVAGEQTITSVLIEGGAHHLDLMYSHPDDPASVKAARALELQSIKKWIAQYRLHAPAKSWGDDL